MVLKLRAEPFCVRDADDDGDDGRAVLAIAKDENTNANDALEDTREQSAWPKSNDQDPEQKGS